MIYCEKAEFGQISRSFSLNSGAICLKRPKNLTQIGFPSLRSVKSDRLAVITAQFPHFLFQREYIDGHHCVEDGGQHEKFLECLTCIFHQGGR